MGEFRTKKISYRWRMEARVRSVPSKLQFGCIDTMAFEEDLVQKKKVSGIVGSPCYCYFASSNSYHILLYYVKPSMLKHELL